MPIRDRLTSGRAASVGGPPLGADIRTPVPLRKLRDSAARSRPRVRGAARGRVRSDAAAPAAQSRCSRTLSSEQVRRSSDRTPARTRSAPVSAAPVSAAPVSAAPVTTSCSGSVRAAAARAVRARRSMPRRMLSTATSSSASVAAMMSVTMVAVAREVVSRWDSSVRLAVRQARSEPTSSPPRPRGPRLGRGVPASVGGPCLSRSWCAGPVRSGQVCAPSGPCGGVGALGGSGAVGSATHIGLRTPPSGHGHLGNGCGSDWTSAPAWASTGHLGVGPGGTGG